jgi:hypothetical protein
VRRFAVVALLLLLLPACKDKKKTDDDAAGRAARGRLAVLAGATANGSYDAVYKFEQRPSGTSGLIRIRQLPPQYRIDVTAKSTASFFSLTNSVVSCTEKNKKTSCFLVAKPGEPVPALFDPGVQRLFRDAVEELAANPNDYSVTTVAEPSPEPSPDPNTLPLPHGECFAVTRASTPSPDDGGGFENGTYCFAEEGLATYIEVASGTLTLRTLRPTPKADAFKPPATVQKLPELSPTPSKS